MNGWTNQRTNEQTNDQANEKNKEHQSWTHRKNHWVACEPIIFPEKKAKRMIPIPSECHSALHFLVHLCIFPKSEHIFVSFLMLFGTKLSSHLNTYLRHNGSSLILILFSKGLTFLHPPVREIFETTNPQDGIMIQQISKKTNRGSVPHGILLGPKRISTQKMCPWPCVGSMFAGDQRCLALIRWCWPQTLGEVATGAVPRGIPLGSCTFLWRELVVEFQPIWIINESNWIIEAQGSGWKNKKWLKPPPRFCVEHRMFFDSSLQTLETQSNSERF